MGRAHSSAQDQQPHRRARGAAAPSLEGVLALQQMAGNRAVATLARETFQKLEPMKQPTERVTATVTLPGGGAVQAWTDMPKYNTATLKELHFTSVDEDVLWEAALKAIETGKALGTVQLSWSPTSEIDGAEVQHATLKNARITSYQPGGMDASGGGVRVTTWSLSFKSFTRQPRRRQRQQRQR